MPLFNFINIFHFYNKCTKNISNFISQDVNLTAMYIIILAVIFVYIILY